MKKIVSGFAVVLLCVVSGLSQQVQTLQETDSLGVRRQKTNANFSLLKSLLDSKVGFPVLDTTTLFKDDADQTRTLRFELGALSTGSLRIVHWPDSDLTIAGIDLAQTFTFKQTFGAGINILPAASNPSSPDDGDIAYNSTDNKFKFRENGAWVELPTQTGDNLSVNGTAATDADFDNATPAAPANGFNIRWQKDTSTPNNISGHILTTDIGSTTFGGGSSFTWTFDGGGTPSQITFSSATVNVAVGTLQQGGVAVPTISSTDSLSNKTLVTPIIVSFVNAGHAHADSAGGGQLNASNIFNAGTVPVARLPLMVGDSGSGGTAGLVPAPAAGDAAAGKFLDASGAWSVPAGGGGGTPGGSNTQVQYNNSGSFGGIANATSDGATLTLTSPKLITSINDANGNEVVKIGSTTSAVNEVTIGNNSTGIGPIIQATGDDTNIDLILNPKGTGSVLVNGPMKFRGTLAVFTALSNNPPASAFALLDTRNAHPVLLFDPDTDQSAVFSGVLDRKYGGNGVTVTILFASTSTGNVVWNASFERIDAGTLDIDADSFATAQAATCAANATSGVTTACTITFTNSQIDGLLIGEAFRLKTTRDADNGSDTLNAPAQVLRVIVHETP